MTPTQKKSLLMGGLLALVVLMGIAYAAFASNLTITGTSGVSSNWCIGFDSTRTSDYTATAGIAGGTAPTGSMSFSGDSCATNYKTTAGLNSSFVQPGDKVEYTLTIGNKGTLAAAIESINVDNQPVTSDTTITKGSIKFIIEMPQTTSLAVNATTTMKVTAMFQNDTQVSGSGSEQQEINIAINAVQDDGNGGFTPTPSSFDGTGTIYRFSATQLANKGSSAASSYPYTISNLTEGTDYVTNPSTLNKTYYLKHDVVNDEIINSYVCFVYNNAEHCMKGGDGGASFAANTQIIQDYQSFYNLPDNNANPGCLFNSDISRCYGGGFYDVRAYSDGRVNVYVSSSETCDVDNNGYSGCYQ